MSSRLDFKNISTLTPFLSEVSSILPSAVTGKKASSQRKISKAIKRARFLALLPYCAKHNTQL